MANQTPQQNEPKVDTVSVEQLGQSIADAIRAGQPKQKKTYSEVVLKTKNNPTGSRSRKINQPTFVNGYEVNLSDPLCVFSDEELSLLNKVRPGRFVKGMVSVFERDLGAAGKELHVQWDNSLVDRRMALKSECRNLTEILKTCLDEYTAQQAPKK